MSLGAPSVAGTRSDVQALWTCSGLCVPGAERRYANMPRARGAESICPGAKQLASFLAVLHRDTASCELVAGCGYGFSER